MGDIGKQPTHHELPTHPSSHWPHGCLLPSWTSTHKLQDLGQVHEWRGELSWSNLSRRPVLSSRGMVLLSWGRILCCHSIKLPRHQAQSSPIKPKDMFKSPNKDGSCPGPICQGGRCCPHAGWYCCPGGEYCAVTPSNCP